MTPDALQLLFAGIGFMLFVVVLGAVFGLGLARSGQGTERSQIAEVLDATRVLERRYQEEHARREQAEWERNEARADANRLQKDNAALMLAKQEAENRERDATRRADKAEAEKIDALQRATVAERAVKNGQVLFDRLNAQQREMADMKRQLQIAFDEIAQLKAQLAAGA